MAEPDIKSHATKQRLAASGIVSCPLYCGHIHETKAILPIVWVRLRVTTHLLKVDQESPMDITDYHEELILSLPTAKELAVSNL